MNKDLIAPREMSSAELKVLVDEYLQRGGKITECPPGVALNFRSAMMTEEISDKKQVRAFRKKISKK